MTNMGIRRLILSQELGGGNDIFPMYLYLPQVNSREYRLDPTPESIAFVDYFLENAVWDGVATWDLYLKPGLLYIDDMNVTYVGAPSLDGATINTDWCLWHSSKKYFALTCNYIYWYDGYEYPKGTIRVKDDD